MGEGGVRVFSPAPHSLTASLTHSLGPRDPTPPQPNNPERMNDNSPGYAAPAIKLPLPSDGRGPGVRACFASLRLVTAEQRLRNEASRLAKLLDCAFLSWRFSFRQTLIHSLTHRPARSHPAPGPSCHLPFAIFSTRPIRPM